MDFQDALLLLTCDLYCYLNVNRKDIQVILKIFSTSISEKYNPFIHEKLKSRLEGAIDIRNSDCMSDIF